MPNERKTKTNFVPTDDSLVPTSQNNLMPTSRGLTAGSNESGKPLDPAVNPREVEVEEAEALKLLDEEVKNLSHEKLCDTLIPTEYIGLRVDAVLAKLFPDWSRSKLTAWLKSGCILIDQQCWKPNTKVIGGETICFNVPPESSTLSDQAEAIPLEILFEDEHVIVINKPAGLIVHPGAGNRQGTLLNALLHHHTPLQDLPRAGIVHRLDKDTSGIMIIAKTLTAHTHLIRQMQERTIQRQYLTLVYGHLISGSTISTEYGRDPHNRLKMAVLNHGKPAITSFTILKKYHYVTLLQVKLHTGRTHQIRVHMTHINHPIVGDGLYRTRNSLKAGMSKDLRETLTQFPRQALHAQTLSFEHPISQETLTYTAPIPYDLQNLIDFVEKEGQ